MLLDKVINDWPDKIEMASTHLALAECYGKLREPDLAVKHFRLALEAETVMPNVLTRAWLEYPLFVLSNRLTSLYDEIEHVISSRELDRHVSFPIEEYQLSAVKALLSDYRGQYSVAKIWAVQAIEAANRNHSGFRYHAKLGLVSNPGGPIHEQVVEIANRPSQ
jgi:hypothetical protein